MSLPENSGRSNSAATRLAALLETARRQRLLSDDQLQSELRLPRRTLEAIRNAHFDALGPRLYARGFVYAYARQVGAPMDEVQALWAELDGGDDDVPLISHVPARSPVQRAALQAATAVVTLAVLVGPALWLHGQGALNRWFAPREPVAKAEQGVTGTYTLPAPRPLLSVPMDRDSGAAPPLNAGITTLPSAGPGPAAATAAPAPGLVLEMYFHKDCWVEVVDAHGQRLEYDLVRANSQRRFEGEGPFQVFLGRADAVTVAVNGEYFDIGAYRKRNLARFEVTASEQPAAD